MPRVALLLQSTPDGYTQAKNFILDLKHAR